MEVKNSDMTNHVTLSRHRFPVARFRENLYFLTIVTQKSAYVPCGVRLIANPGKRAIDQRFVNFVIYVTNSCLTTNFELNFVFSREAWRASKKNCEQMSHRARKSSVFCLHFKRKKFLTFLYENKLFAHRLFKKHSKYKSKRKFKKRKIL